MYFTIKILSLTFEHVHSQLYLYVSTDYDGDFTEFAGTNQEWYFQNKTGSLVNTLRINVTRKAYKAVFICQAAISYFYTIQFNVTLDVFCKTISLIQTIYKLQRV